jgi:hypothetical protein
MCQLSGMCVSIVATAALTRLLFYFTQDRFGRC